MSERQKPERQNKEEKSPQSDGVAPRILTLRHRTSNCRAARAVLDAALLDGLRSYKMSAGTRLRAFLE